jgi:hypothetical protein
MTNLAELLVTEKRNFLIKANGGIGLPAAGFIYWLGVGIAGFYLTPQTWYGVACFATGLIFPLGILLAKPLKSDVLAKSEISSVLFPALISMLMFWPLAIAGGMLDVSFVPLAIGVGMGLHWPVIGWMYGGKSFMAHAFVRTIGCTLIWFALPAHRFTILPLYVAFVYFVTVLAIKAEVAMAKKKINRAVE